MKPNCKFSEKAIGVISNHGDHHFWESWVTDLRDMGIRHLAYLGPVACVDDREKLISLIEKVPMHWVYGKEDVNVRGAVQVRFGPGAATLSLHGVMFRYALAAPDRAPWLRYYEKWDYPEGISAERLLSTAAQEAAESIVVVGSGLEYERWIWDSRGGTLTQDTAAPRFPESGAQVFLRPDPNTKHIIIHPSSRQGRYSIIDPGQRLMVFNPT